MNDQPRVSVVMAAYNAERFLREAVGSILDQTLTNRNFHAAWVDPDGGLWGVGGYFETPPQTDGFLTYYGTDTISKVAQ